MDTLTGCSSRELDAESTPFRDTEILDREEECELDSYDSGHISCGSMLYFLEDLQRTGSDRLRQLGRACREIRTLASPEDSVDTTDPETPRTRDDSSLGAKVGNSFQAMFGRATQEIASVCQGAAVRMKQFGVRVSATAQLLHQSLNAPGNDDASLQEELDNHEGGSADERLEECVGSYRDGEEEQQSAQDLPQTSIEPEFVGDSTLPKTLTHPALYCVDRQIRNDYPGEGLQMAISEEQTQGRQPRSSEGCNRRRAVSLVTGLGDEPVGQGSGASGLIRRQRTRADSEPRSSTVLSECRNCHQDPTRESYKIVLRRSVFVEKKCYFCDENAVEICNRTSRHICKTEECQKRQVVAPLRKAMAEEN